MDTKQDKIKQGEIPMIGANAMCEMHTGWTAPFDITPGSLDGYNVSDYFDSRGAYRGPDEFGVEPTFREMTDSEMEEFLAE